MTKPFITNGSVERPFRVLWGHGIGTILVSRGEMTSNASLTFWYSFQVAFSYTYELRPYLDLLLQMLLITDSWQNHRIHNTLKGKSVLEF